jgi:purine-binding chemotaxis protein CheW
MAELPVRAQSRGSRNLVRRGAQGPVHEFLAFTLAGELYGVALGKVRQIVTPPPITHVPRAPRDVLGICSVRGLLTTVVDLRMRLRVQASPATRRTRILLTQVDDGEIIGLLVDEVRHVVRLAESQIEVMTGAFGGEVSDHVRGIGRPGGREVMVLLDLRSIVASDK